MSWPICERTSRPSRTILETWECSTRNSTIGTQESLNWSQKERARWKLGLRRRKLARGGRSYSAAHGEAARAIEFTPSAELKKLYRDVAKRVHPDLATDGADRAERERLMAEANRAYRQGDVDALRRILEEYESSPESVQGTGVAADLVRVIRQIKQLQKRLVQIELEITSLGTSDIAKLKVKAEDVSNQGRNLLAEMAQDLKRRIDHERRRFESLSAKERTP